jgi:hypothetical protein
MYKKEKKEKKEKKTTKRAEHSRAIWPSRQAPHPSGPSLSHSSRWAPQLLTIFLR